MKSSRPMMLTVWILLGCCFSGCLNGNDGDEVLTRESMVGCWESHYGIPDSAYYVSWNVFPESVLWTSAWRVSPEKTANGKMWEEMQEHQFQRWSITDDSLYFEIGIGYMVTKEDGVVVDSLASNFSHWKGGYLFEKGRIVFPKTAMERCRK